MAQSQHKKLFIIIAALLGGFCLLVFTILVALARGTIYTRHTFHEICYDCAIVTERVHQRLLLEDTKWTNVVKTPLHQTLFPEVANHNHHHEGPGLSQFVLELTRVRRHSFDLELPNLGKNPAVAEAFGRIKDDQSPQQARDLWKVFLQYVSSRSRKTQDRPWDSGDANNVLTFLKRDPQFSAFQKYLQNPSSERHALWLKSEVDAQAVEREISK